MRLLRVSPWQVRFPDWDVRAERSSEHVAELEADIKRRGIINPLIVYKPADWDQNHEYEVIDGYHRLFIARKLNLSSIPVLVIDDVGFDPTELAFQLNRLQQTLSPLDIARYIEKCVKRFDTGVKGVAERLGISRQQIYNYLKLLKLPESKLRQLRENNWRGWTRAIRDVEVESEERERRRGRREGLKCFICNRPLQRGEFKWIPLCLEDYERALKAKQEAEK